MKISAPPAALQDGPLPAYRARLRAGELSADPAQAQAAERLQLLWARLRGYDPLPFDQPGDGFFSRLLRRKKVEEHIDCPFGLYIVGDVGRGKSMLMDLFFAAADVARKRRVHFHAFMQDVHARLHAYERAQPDADDPIPPLADALSAEAALLCFDEFQVNDIADAMILGRLFQALFARGVVVVATSNTAPDRLFEGQPGRDAFLPFIALIKQHLDVLALDGARDYRRARLRELLTWHVPAGAEAAAALDAAFTSLTGGAAPRPERLAILGRMLLVPRAAEGVARFAFTELCGQPLGAPDYLAIATHYEALVIDDIPSLGPDNRDEARRFITLVDALYEHRVKLLASAEAPPDRLYEHGDGADAFRRTVSRLDEMQSADWRALPHLT